MKTQPSFPIDPDCDGLSRWSRGEERPLFEGRPTARVTLLYLLIAWSIILGTLAIAQQAATQPSLPPSNSASPADSVPPSSGVNAQSPAERQADEGTETYRGAYRVGGGVSAPKRIYGPDPEYTQEARKARYEGTVVLWLIVGIDGKPHQIRVQRPLGMGLDEEAVKAVKDWRFEPSKKDGQPVPVMINVDVNFRLPPTVPAEPKEAYEKAAASGDSSAMTKLGFMYVEGKDVPQDYKQAKAWLEKAAVAGDASAMTGLGILYQEGWGVAQDYKTAREWYEKAAAAGNTDAMRALGSLYFQGRGVPQDDKAEFQWYKRAADAGDAKAMVVLGLLYERGVGVPQSYEKAKEWYEWAADAGETSAMVDLGNLYYYGHGVPQDRQRAHE